MKKIRESIADISGVQNALIVFVDVIDSSKYGAVLGMKRYAEQILKLQELFKETGAIYFPFRDGITSYSEVRTRGDEGTIFYIDPESDPSEMVFKAVQFAFELKARIELFTQTDENIDIVPQKMKIGVGIHFGEVAQITEIKRDEKGTPKSVISDLIGFSINYAKRVESCSRFGKHSKVFLSKEAASFLEGEPIVLVKHTMALKGIKSSDEVFEVRSAFFEKMPLNPKSFDPEKFIDTYSTKAKELDLVNEPWLKGFVMSVMDTRLKEVKIDVLKTNYRKKLSEFAWTRVAENDPILLFWRAKEYGENKKYTQMLTYLKQLVERYPNFIHARKKLVKAFWEVTKYKKISAEWILARDIAEEFLGRFSQYLSEEEKKFYEEILQQPCIERDVNDTEK